MNPRIFTLALAIVLASAPPLPAQAAPDASIADNAIRSLNSYSRLTVFDDVNVYVDNGTVTLRGRVTMPVKKEDIARRVGALEGVRAVRNEIAVLPASVHDDALRKKISRAIYGNSAFWRFAALPNPPIHIVVENGRVTLTGIVPGEVDRALAGSLATGHGEISVVNELRTDAESRNARQLPF